MANNKDYAINSYVQELTASGVNPDTIKQRAQQYGQIYDGTIQKGKVEL
jgi:hypothetical protein